MELDDETSKPPEQTIEASEAATADKMEVQTSPEQLESEPDVTPESSAHIATKAAEVPEDTSSKKDKCEDAELLDIAVTGVHGANATHGEELINDGGEMPNSRRPPTIPILQEDSPSHSIEVRSKPESPGENQPDSQGVTEDGKDDAKNGCEASLAEKPAPASRPS